MLSKKASKRKKMLEQIGTLIAEDVTINGDLHVGGGIQVDGCVNGGLSSENKDAIVRLSNSGTIRGEVRAPNVIINGRVDGNVYAGEHLELAESAVIHGDVHYNLIEVKIGAQIDGKLIHDEGCTVTEDQPEAAAIPLPDLKPVIESWEDGAFSQNRVGQFD